MSDNFKKVELKGFRYYQEEADNAIYEELLINNKCIIKMFCGTGKSLLMRKCKSVQNQKLVVYVFPSLSLIDQFCTDYFAKKDSPFKISSENGSTTDPALIKTELKKKKNKIICVTYQSYKTLLDNLGSIKIDVCIYDEAHHAVGETYQKLIFENETNACEKQIFFTATPKDDNGIVMCDRNNLEAGMCGKLVYDYSYLRGMNEGYLNPFEIRVDMYTENTNKSVYESIARAILVSGNNRVLTFHADVNTDRDTSVINFVDESSFVSTFMKVLIDEFPEKAELYTTFKMIALDASIKPDKRRAILDKFDTSLDNEVYIISSCETIGEGIDTKNANMCVFVDPKSSFVKIIQNIGRIVRPQSKPSTVLIPCWVDREKYVGCDEDREKCDEVIRTDLNKDGNFNGILNVLSALRQEDEDLYDACLNYGEDVDDKSNYSSSRDDSDSEDEYSENSDSEDYDYDDEIDAKPKHKINISFHTNDEIKVLWKISSDIDIMKNMCSCVLECEVVEYDPMEVAFGIVERAKERERNGGKLLPRNSCRNKNKTYSEEELQEGKDCRKIGSWKLWYKGNFKNGRKCPNEVYDYLDKELDGWRIEINLDEKALQDAKEIVSRKTQRPYLLPRNIDKKHRITQQLIQEDKDSTKLNNWKNSLKGQGTGRCSSEVSDYLDKHLQGWRTELDEKIFKTAKEIVERAIKRQDVGCNFIPIRCCNDKTKTYTDEEIQQHNDASKLGRWRSVLNGSKQNKFTDEACRYLDEHLKGWRTTYDEISFQQANEIVKRAIIRQSNGTNFIPIQCCTNQNKTYTEDEIQESKDAVRLSEWKKKKNGQLKCPIITCEYLDKNLKGWRTEQNEKSIQQSKEIVERANTRRVNGYNFIPIHCCFDATKTYTLEELQQDKDAHKLGMWKQALNGCKENKCSDEVRDYLDKYLKGWRDNFDQKAIQQAKEIIERANTRLLNKKNFIPMHCCCNKTKTYTEDELQEHKDAAKLGTWKKALNGSKKSKCADEVRDYLDEHLKGWRTEIDFDEKALQDAKAIVLRKTQRPNLLPRRIRNKEDQKTQELEQENKDYIKLRYWKSVLNGKGNNARCSDQVREYLDEHLKGWRTTDDNSVEEQEEEIIIVPKKKSMKLKEQTAKKETVEQRKQRTKSELEVLHQRYKTLTSQNLQKEFKETPDLWRHYHAVSEENEKSFPEEGIPRNRIINEMTEIKGKRTRTVVDMGCGKAHIADHFANDKRFTFINYDHVSSKQNIEVKDISNTGLEDDSVDICILCLAMWGSNCHDYVREAYRILESGGKLYIMEATKRWTSVSESIECGQLADKLKKLLEESGFQIDSSKKPSVEKFSLFVCAKA